HSLHASYAAQGNFAGSSADATLNVNKATASITVNGYEGTYDGQAHGASGSASGVNSTNLSGFLNLGASFTDSPGGTAHWVFTGGTNYFDKEGDVAIVINKATASITVNGYSGIYDAAAHGATGSASGVNSTDLSASLDLGISFTDSPGGTAYWS